jgi:hypothetical protein
VRANLPRFSEVEEDFIEVPRRFLRREEDEDDYPDSPDERDDLSSSYEVDFSRWFNYATAHWSSVLGASIGFSLILGMIQVALGFIPFVSPIIALLIMPSLQAGYVIVYLAQLKGKRWEFGDFFGGFQWWGAILANQLLLALMVLPCVVPFLVMMIALMVARAPGMRGGGAEAVLFVMIPLLLVGVGAAIYVSVRVSFFSQMLIIDRNYGPIEAIKGSWRLTRGHFWSLFGVAFLLGLINLGGLVACFIGVLFTTPLTGLVPVAGYLLIAGRRPPLPRPRRPRYA